MLGRLRNSFAEIDLTVLEQNFLSLQALLPAHCFMAPMVKADAYGHGDIQVARVCERLGARFLGVSLIEEGIKIRLEGIQTPILVFSTFDSMGAEALVKYRLTPVINSFDQITKLKTAVSETAGYPAHVEFNTGMQRLGFSPEDAKNVAREFSKDNVLKLEGACTHFCSSEDYGHAEGQTQSQIAHFEKIMADLKYIIQNPIRFHYLNSAAMLVQLQPRLDLARPGISLYGAYPKLPQEIDAKINPVMTVKSYVGFVHHLKKGTKVSYGGTWTAPKDSSIAVIPMGYADGIPRALSNRGHVLIRGERCPIVGIVCMDYFMVDVSGLAEKGITSHVGDEVVFLGTQKNAQIRAEEIAALVQSIPYEVFTGIQARIPRVFIH